MWTMWLHKHLSYRGLAYLFEPAHFMEITMNNIANCPIVCRVPELRTPSLTNHAGYRGRLTSSAS